MQYEGGDEGSLAGSQDEYSAADGHPTEGKWGWGKGVEDGAGDSVVGVRAGLEREVEGTEKDNRDMIVAEEAKEATLFTKV